MEISPRVQSFVFHFGEMGSRWGFNRTVGQMYALLVVTERPLSATELAETLNISRGNVSMGMKELQSWRLVQVSHIPGDRKEYYRVTGSIWDMANTIFEERKKREVDPTLSLLRDNLLEEPKDKEEAFAFEKMQEIHDLLEMLTQWSGELQRLSPEKLSTLMKLGAGVSKMLSMKDQLFTKNSQPTSDS
ncbi:MULTISPECIES: GbsR/MarR family transcriptional regulator [unclassified Motilimonas]|uniref:GbsR/MarR family transcriptional regulator n=1 Tax=Motilimonas TaxID=1914248 RepID=UPI001E4AA3D6|nr:MULTISPECIES: GbsR/MarR family transcriptional regulator [unclassified Motilimonas]MCE0556816.1 GbsR/MarR family transcriptional regulator [Motilimonas sp. E26]MDO6525134.1 GbsR/MarR family transcriptional regulator [Motilimonas sp. 1_MG-2023]